VDNPAYVRMVKPGAESGCSWSAALSHYAIMAFFSFSDPDLNV
jgi:hypothetical protein